MSLVSIVPPQNFTKKPNRQNSKYKHLMLIHWLMAILIMLLYLTGLYVAHPPQSNLIKWLSPFLHQSLGTLFMLMLLARIFLLLRVVSSKYSKRLPTVKPAWLKTMILHTVLYFFMLIAPLSGLFLRNFRGVDTTFFGISIPPVFAANSSWVAIAVSVHFWVSYIFLVFIGLHVMIHWKVVRCMIHWKMVR
jgi:cytochrome b561